MQPDKKKVLIYQTPVRKKIEGLLLFFLGLCLLYYWFSLGCLFNLMGSSLFIISFCITFFGTHRALSFQTTRLDEGSNIIRQLKLHFGFIKKKKKFKADNITIFSNDLYSFTCAVFAYSGDIDPREVMPEKRFIIIDAISNKQAKKICKNINELCPIKYRSSKK